ncbi:Protein of uncharacterised function (DUF3114) [Streptococcus criceti]|uniref:DUF3114 domain-containing protein n=1 Tax=Streptococcus criceti HS-6 TaxID=873449 RepID=G5JRM3_STRCG|nr:DUF3114 domain-containing protein [Streptococcus criceti]EHI75492.1 hypothetical protein STRCR_2032 [Streptococcus criceti HS-6]SUN42885.1 Protein of uncharacterised function (DUF3114) [Streptococcus criceti]
MQLVDGNSVNYAESSGKGKHHGALDSDPVSKYDPKVRKEVGKNWNNPDRRRNQPDYFDVDRSEVDANDRLKE